jgi:hypothetical protein
MRSKLPLTCEIAGEACSEMTYDLRQLVIFESHIQPKIVQDLPTRWPEHLNFLTVRVSASRATSKKTQAPHQISSWVKTIE